MDASPALCDLVRSSMIEELLGGVSHLKQNLKKSTYERIVFPDPAVRFFSQLK